MPVKPRGKAFLLFAKKSNLIWCTDSDKHWFKHVAFLPHPNNRLFGNVYTAKTWKTQKGAQRWLDERSYPLDYWTIVEVDLDKGVIVDDEVRTIFDRKAS